MRIKLALLLLVFGVIYSTNVSAFNLFDNFSLNGGTVIYFQGANPSITSQLPSPQKGFGEVLDLALNYEGKYFNFYSRFHNGNGQGADKLFADYLFANLNTLADDNTDDNYDLKLLEAYLSFNFFNDNLNIILGKTEPFLFIDQNEFANDEITQFIGKPFVNNIFFDVEDRYSPILGFAYTSGSFEFSGFLQSIENHKVFFDGKEWVMEETGVHHYDENLASGFQVNYKADFHGLKGNYRFFIYNNTVPHFRCYDDLSDPDRKPSLIRASGFGLSFDQYVSEKIGVFFRYGKSYHNVHHYDNFYSFGFSIDCLMFENDSILIGFSKINGNEKGFKDENHFEMQYRFFLNENMLAAFDYQYVENLIDFPKADLTAITVRLTLSF
ncbi:carbohydrate-selective porin OprB [Thermotomaculum hydrothermale]|uniref:Carbohydrate-selective porin OprB n=1 Tax=Thermotomaculum hydrothermale TaxID=981385 RepID=A0A7R6PFB0_9BACT|nr:hypothetical protein [Thermotomaculum hydrothermale]BBB32674.1 carbohydrate-selective porin OprB [Thermotomaculum hydrothermale]